MIFALLKDLIGGRDVQNMKYSEANRLVNEFYLRVEIATFGNRHPEKIEYYTNKALERAGLGCFA